MRDYFRLCVNSFLGFVLLFSAGGCAPLVIGALAVGVVGGYVVSPDTVEGVISCPIEELWDASKEIVAIMGEIQEENEQQGQIFVTINAARVVITLTAIGSDRTKMNIKARKSFIPKISLAQDVYAKIVNGLEK